MRKLAMTLSAIGGALGLMVWAGPASAAKIVVSDVELGSQNGFELSLGGTGFRANGSGFGVFEVKGEVAGADYSARAEEVSKRKFVMGLGDVGEVDLSFDVEESKKRIGKNLAFCGIGKAKTIKRKGTFQGIIDFQGEDGYLGFEAASAPGKQVIVECLASSRTRPLQATPRPAARAAGRRYVMLNCGPRRSPVDEFLLEMGLDSGPAKYDTNYSTRLDGGVETFKYVSLNAPRETFTPSDDLRTATVSPPEPFSGTATFTADSGSRNFRTGPLTGDLAVDFPGAPDVALTPSRTDLARTSQDGFCT